MMHAAASGQLETVKLLHRLGADVKAVKKVPAAAPANSTHACVRG